MSRSKAYEVKDGGSSASRSSGWDVDEEEEEDDDSPPQLPDDHHLQVVNEKGVFCSNFQQFMRKWGLEHPGNVRMVVIIGPQSSGKSTLLNSVFNTRFVTMNGKKGRSRTTQGLWVSGGEAGGWSSSNGSHFLVMDVEGVDGFEKGGDNISFENRAALFALAMADVLLVNVFETSINLDNAACLPLLRCVFEGMLKLYPGGVAGGSGSRSGRSWGANNQLQARPRPLLLFVLRDYKGQTPQETHLQSVRKMLAEVWAEVRQRVSSSSSSSGGGSYGGSREVALEDLFAVEVHCVRKLTRGGGEVDVAVAAETRRLFSDARHPQFVCRPGRTGNVYADAEEVAQLGARVWAQIEAERGLDM